MGKVVQGSLMLHGEFSGYGFSRVNNGKMCWVNLNLKIVQLFLLILGESFSSSQLHGCCGDGLACYLDRWIALHTT